MNARGLIIAILFFAVLGGVAAVALGVTGAGANLQLAAQAFGVLVSAIVTIGSTTFIANGLAGLMLRTFGNFKEGDFLKVGDDFGRVTERRLLHVEIQTEDRDLTTLPNMYLVTQPVKVVRSSGTLVSARLSLGYDVSHSRVELLLIAAANAADLDNPFVQIRDLGDFSVTYRVVGFTADVKKLVSLRSTLRARILDTLHENGVEIVSPSFMNQRALDPAVPAIPPITEPPRHSLRAVGGPEPDEMMFDKADASEQLEGLKQEHAEVSAEIERLTKELDGSSPVARLRIDRGINWRRSRLEWLDDAIATTLETIGD